MSEARGIILGVIFMLKIGQKIRPKIVSRWWMVTHLQIT
nr:MAG TPA: hypothetical protein [Caudoviricetes sp.]